jgi:hypothetical protein
MTLRFAGRISPLITLEYRLKKDFIQLFVGEPPMLTLGVSYPQYFLGQNFIR